MPPALRLTRALVDRLPARVDEEGPVRGDPTPPEHYPNTADRLLAEADPSGLWVFASGSLIWNPRMPVAERRHALVHGWHRSFCLGPIRRFRGSPQAPGYMLSLDRGGSCHGIVQRMEPGNERADLIALLEKEPPRPPKWVRAKTAQGMVRAVAFTMDRTWWAYCPEGPIEEVADALAGAVGTGGTMAEYLLNTCEHLAEAGIHDSHLWRLQDMVAERLERLPERASI
ncbi:gamma-glutamylcyclotransferase [Pararhodobacter sp. CCB-MM2]|uniref:gamma-glutamylcyclotransferase n=1 Tax=Pararhodobacter sp. CCB-MM2 TaxID=1786003 RepID=UPI00082F258C|nr:gamma-glutamylcyclotransferase [Pararhodobacter sp. CCB-MM2]